MFILGAGASYPEGVITDSDLAALGIPLSAATQDALARSGVKARRTILPDGFIRTHKGADVLQSRAAATSSPTALGLAAARQALARAGVAAEQVGLVLADCATPRQTCPSEAQRIAGSLGLKVPAYDITAGIGALALVLDVLGSWKPERVPDYVLCMSTNTPTELVRYGEDPLAASLLGDAASAVVVSPRHRAGLEARRSFLTRDRSVRPPVSVSRAVSVDLSMPGELLRNQLSSGLLQLGAPKAARLIGPQLFGAELQRIAASLSVDPDKVVDSAKEAGYSLGSSLGCALSAVWDEVSRGESVAILHEGDGISAGALLERVG